MPSNPARFKATMAAFLSIRGRVVSVRVGSAGLYSRPMRVLICPDKFRGTLSARQTTDDIARGWRGARPEDALDVVPLADGGEGTLDVLVPYEADAAERRTIRVHGPLDDPIDAEFGLRDGVAIVEMARASGLELLDPGRRDPRRTTTRGTGELMRAALDSGVQRLMVCLGGSATNDGGVGMAGALGARFFDSRAKTIRSGAAAIVDLWHIDTTLLHPRLDDVDVIGVTDVDNPLCGPSGASAVYGPQKGASADDVWELDEALRHLAAVVHRDLGIDPKDEPGAGAAGGLGYGLLAFCGARLRPGVEVVMETVGFEPRLASADLVITGEGSLDDQSLRGKVAAGVLRAASIASAPVAILCGMASVRPDGAVVRSLVDRVGPDAAVRDARRSLELVAEELARDPVAASSANG
jgi:glycerate 2-kinase